MNRDSLKQFRYHRLSKCMACIITIWSANVARADDGRPSNATKKSNASPRGQVEVVGIFDPYAASPNFWSPDGKSSQLPRGLSWDDIKSPNQQVISAEPVAFRRRILLKWKGTNPPEFRLVRARRRSKQIQNGQVLKSDIRYLGCDDVSRGRTSDISPVHLEGAVGAFGDILGSNWCHQ